MAEIDLDNVSGYWQKLWLECLVLSWFILGLVVLEREKPAVLHLMLF